MPGREGFPEGGAIDTPYTHSPEELMALQEYALREGITVNEAISRGVGILLGVDMLARAKGEAIQLIGEFSGGTTMPITPEWELANQMLNQVLRHEDPFRPRAGE